MSPTTNTCAIYSTRLSSPFNMMASCMRSKPCRGSWRAWRHAARRPAGGTGHRELLHPPAASKDDLPGDGGGFNIDDLAARLAAEAGKMRESLQGSLDDLIEDQQEGEGLAGLDGLPDTPPSLLQPLGFQATSSQEDMLAEVGDGGFFSTEFEIEEQLGQISIQQVMRSYDPDDLLPASERQSRAAVIAYVGKYFSGMPFQDPVYVMLKEYLPGARAVACNELQILKYLAGMPEAGRKWSRAKAALAPDPPVAQLLGYFVAGLSEPARQMLYGDPSGEPAVGPSGAGAASSSSTAGPAAASASAAAAGPYLADPSPGPGESTLWVVMKWEGLTPVALYPAAPQQRTGFGMLWGDRDPPLKDRVQMLRCICRGALAALAYCHARGVVHGSLGSGSVLLSTFDDREAERLVVKLDNFGFSRRILPPGSTPVSKDGGAVLVPPPDLSGETPLALGQKEDLRALALVLLECLLSALVEGGPSPLTSGEAVARLLGEVFNWDMQEFRDYCEGETGWSTFVAFLDDEGYAGWALMEALVLGTKPAGELLTCRFCQL